jgi:hypothetical protein
MTPCVTLPIAIANQTGFRGDAEARSTFSFEVSVDTTCPALPHAGSTTVASTAAMIARSGFVLMDPPC